MTLGRLKMAATLALGPLELPGIERQRLQEVEQGAAQGMEGPIRVKGQITSLE